MKTESEWPSRLKRDGVTRLDTVETGDGAAGLDEMKASCAGGNALKLREDGWEFGNGWSLEGDETAGNKGGAFEKCKGLGGAD